MAVKLAPDKMRRRGLAAGAPPEGMALRENAAWLEQEHDHERALLAEVQELWQGDFAPKVSKTTTDVGSGEPDASLGLCIVRQFAYMPGERAGGFGCVWPSDQDVTEQVKTDLDEAAKAVLERGEIPPTSTARQVVTDIARRIAALLADRTSVEVAAFADGEGGAELVLDSFVTRRRVSAEISPTGAANVTTIDEFARLSSSPFDGSNRRRLEELIEWLTTTA